MFFFNFIAENVLYLMVFLCFLYLMHFLWMHTYNDCLFLAEEGHCSNFGLCGCKHVTESKDSLHFYRFSCIYDIQKICLLSYSLSCPYRPSCFSSELLLTQNRYKFPLNCCGWMSTQIPCNSLPTWDLRWWLASLVLDKRTLPQMLHIYLGWRLPGIEVMSRSLNAKFHDCVTNPLFTECFTTIIY